MIAAACWRRWQIHSTNKGKQKLLLLFICVFVCSRTAYYLQKRIFFCSPTLTIKSALSLILFKQWRAFVCACFFVIQPTTPKPIIWYIDIPMFVVALDFYGYYHCFILYVIKCVARLRWVNWKWYRFVFRALSINLTGGILTNLYFAQLRYRTQVENIIFFIWIWQFRFISIWAQTDRFSIATNVRHFYIAYAINHIIHYW